MVIISKDDDLSFLKEQATTGTGIRSSNNPHVMSNNPPVVIVPSPTTIAYKGEQQQQLQKQLHQQLQQQLNQSFLNNNAKNNNNTLINNNTLQQQQQQQSQPQQLQQQQQNAQNTPATYAKAILICRPQSHPFQKRMLRLEPNQEVKVGRAVARNKVCETNAIFECKVLSRNHAVIWYGNGRFFIKDTGSSNGTFINNHRLSEASFASEPYEVNSGDVVQFGVEVVENERKDTHGCIVATLKLYLPDGPETKTRQADTKVSAADLYRLNQYMQEAVKREHILETKLLNLQKNIQVTRKNSANNWQAMIDEDRLLSRIDYLEKKLQYFEKNVTEDKLKEDVVKLQEDKNEYQNSAKEALRKVYQERQDAVQKLTALERALITNDDECSSLRDQLTKTQQQLTDLTNELCQMQTQYEEKCCEMDETKRKMEMEILSCHHKISELQFEIENYEQNQMAVRVNVVADWLSKSDIKKNKGSEDIIKAICNDNDDNEDDSSNMENKCALIYEKLLAIEKNIYSIVGTNSQECNKLENDSINISPKIVNNQNNGSATLTEVDEKTDPSSTEQEQQQSPPKCDNNQNNMNEDNQVMETKHEKNHDNLILNNSSDTINEELKVNLKTNFSQLLDMFSSLMHQLTELQRSVRDNKHTENMISTAVEDVTDTETIISASTTSSCEDISEVFVGSGSSASDDDDEETTMAGNLEELESQLLSLKLELETRPSFKEYQDRLKHIEDLNDSVTIARLETTNLRLQIENNLSVMKTLESELNDVKKVQHQKVPDAADKDTEMEKDTKKVDVCFQTELSDNANPVAIVSKSQSDGLGDRNVSDIDNNNLLLIEEELQMINHPAVEQEEELILYKEKYTNLTSEKIRLEQQLQQMRVDYDNYKNKSLTNLILYLSPIIAIISYLMFSYLVK